MRASARFGSDDRLERAAQRHSGAMDAANFFSHNSPERRLAADEDQVDRLPRRGLGLGDRREPALGQRRARQPARRGQLLDAELGPPLDDARRAATARSASASPSARRTAGAAATPRSTRRTSATENSRRSRVQSRGRGAKAAPRVPDGTSMRSRPLLASLALLAGLAALAVVPAAASATCPGESVRASAPDRERDVPVDPLPRERAAGGRGSRARLPQPEARAGGHGALPRHGLERLLRPHLARRDRLRRAHRRTPGTSTAPAAGSPARTSRGGPAP